MTSVSLGDGDRLQELVDRLRTHNAQLEQALASRIVIEQAKGVLCERYRLDVEAAFELLRRAARSNRVRIHDLARAVVESRATPKPIELELLRGSVTTGRASARPAADGR